MPLLDEIRRGAVLGLDGNSRIRGGSNSLYAGMRQGRRCCGSTPAVCGSIKHCAELACAHRDFAALS